MPIGASIAMILSLFVALTITPYLGYIFLREKDKKVIQKATISDTNTVKFELLPPGKYIARAIIDTNKNNKWDTGSYLHKTQPEKVVYYPAVFNIRSNWHLPSEIFTIN